MNKIKNKKRGFTLIEILVVIGIIAILAAVVLVAINPARQFAQARDSQRVSNLNAILNAIGQRMADNKGVFETGCTAGALPVASTTMASTTYAIRPCLVPTYLSELPVDPTNGVTYDPATGNYDTGYKVYKDINGRVHVLADIQEPNIPRTAAIEIVR